MSAECRPDPGLLYEHMFDHTETTQLTLFRGSRPAHRAAGGGRNARMALRLDRMADEAEVEAERLRSVGDELGERRERERARDARRSATILRAGPGGVARVMAS